MTPIGRDAADLPAVSEAAVRTEQVRLLYGSPLVQLINLINASIVGFVLRHIYPAWLILCWVGLFIVVISARVLLWRHFQSRWSSIEAPEPWSRGFALGAAVTGVLWGFLANVVFRTEEPAYHIFVVFVLGGMIAGAALRDAVYLPAFYGFALAAILPMVAALLWKNDAYQFEMGLLLAAFSLTLLLVGRDNNRWIVDAIWARLALERNNEELRNATSELKREMAERQRTLVELEEIRARLSAIGQHALDAIVILDPDGKVSYWNPAAEQLFGYSADEMMGRSYHALIVPENMRAKAIEGYRRFAETGQGPVLGKTLTLTALRKDGVEVPVDLSVSSLRLGGAWHGLGIVRNVSETKLAEERVREAALYTRSLIEASLDPMAALSPEGVITDVNDALVRVIGLSRDAIVGTKYLDYVTDPDKARAGFQRVFDQGSLVDYPLSIRHASGKITELVFNATLYRSEKGAVVGAFVLGRDMTERMRIEAALRERERDLRDAQHLAHLGSWELSPRADAPKWSGEIYQIFRRDPGLPAPSLEEHAHIFAPESFERWRAAFAELQHSGTPYEIDLEIVRMDGTPAWIAAHGEADRDENGLVGRLHGTVQDITARKLAEKTLASLHRELGEKLEVLRRHERAMAMIAKLSDILQACKSRTEAYPIIVSTANNLFEETNGALSIVTDVSNVMETVAQWGVDRMALPSFAFDDCWALRTGHSYYVKGADAGMACRHFIEAPRRPYVCVPLTVYGETTGLLHLNLAAGDAISEEMQQLLVTFGDVVKLSLSNLKLRERLSEQAMRDQLTTLFNRHYLAETLPREIRRAQRTDKPLSVAMLDIDHFKEFNDTRGHEAGDVVLREFGAILRESMRAGDIACRYGGEEFLLVLPECDASDARARVQEICSEIKGRSFEHHGQALPGVTVSAGLAQLGDDIAFSDALIAAADEALYSAKRNGRDRIETSERKRKRPAPSSAS